ncbi:hypothetical protein BDF19DRAFT_310747 [Syncephalis fuscata]|nr:hypothetical protein BDF19DRAFT_310747 [Syncephalis fuscata]
MMRKTIFGITLSVCLLVLSAGALAKQIIPDQNAFTDNTIQGILADNAMPFFLLNKIDKLDKSEPSPTVPDPLKALATATPTAITIAESTKDFTKLPTQKSDLGISGLSVEGIWRINKGQAKLFGWYYGKSVVVYCLSNVARKPIGFRLTIARNGRSFWMSN